MNPDPTKRPTAKEALQHQWLTDHKPDGDVDLSAGLRENWNPKQKFKTAVRKVMAANRFNSAGESARARRGTDASTTSTLATTTTDDDTDDNTNRSFTTADHSPQTDVFITPPPSATTVDTVAQGVKSL